MSTNTYDFLPRLNTDSNEHIPKAAFLKTDSNEWETMTIDLMNIDSGGWAIGQTRLSRHYILFEKTNKYTGKCSGYP